MKQETTGKAKISYDLYAQDPDWFSRLLAAVYSQAVKIRLYLYHSGWLRSGRLPVRIICVGNITVGGVGKTPTVIMIAEKLSRLGFKTAVLSRGYGGDRQPGVRAVSDGEEVLLTPAQAGDEPYLMALSLPGVPVVIGADRLKAAQYALDQWKSEFLIMDDGFQHLSLHRDVNLLLLDSVQPFGNGYLLPAGPLREPTCEADRADAFILTRCQDQPSASIETLNKRFPDRPVFLSRHIPVGLTALDGGEQQSLDYLMDLRVIAACGLARPEIFLNTLEDLGAVVEKFVPWPDHYRPEIKDLWGLEMEARNLKLRDCLITAKDAVKMSDWTPTFETGAGPLRIWSLDIKVELLGNEDTFWNLLLARD